jgi:hypothetical protein
MELSALIIKYVSVLTEISYHRRGAKGAECESAVKFEIFALL